MNVRTGILTFGTQYDISRVDNPSVPLRRLQVAKLAG